MYVEVLVRAPLVVVTLDSGESVDMSHLYKEKPLALVFLRHFGCIFCREQITQLRNFTTENIVFVSMGKVEEAATFRAKMESPQPIISDPLKTLYDQFGLRRGQLNQMLNPNTFKRGMQATLSGNRGGLIPPSDPWMLAGTFIINTNGEIIFSHFSRDAADNMSGESIVAKLKEAESLESTPQTASVE